MDGLNTCAISGNLTRDPELRATQGGMEVLSLCVAVNGSRKVGDGWEEYPNFIDCVMFGRRTASVAQYLGKGTYVALTGKLRQERWEAKDGTKRSRVTVVADNIHFEARGERPQAKAAAPDIYDQDIPF